MHLAEPLDVLALLGLLSVPGQKQERGKGPIEHLVASPRGVLPVLDGRGPDPRPARQDLLRRVKVFRVRLISQVAQHVLDVLLLVPGLYAHSLAPDLHLRELGSDDAHAEPQPGEHGDV